MKANEFNMLFENSIKTAKNSFISILTKLFNENHNDDNELVFKNETYYYVPNGFCFPSKMFMNVNHRLVVIRDFDWDDATTDYAETCVDDMTLNDLFMFCQYVNEHF